MNAALKDRYINALFRHRWLVLALAIVVMLCAAAGGRNITTTNDQRSLFGEHNPYLQAFEALEDVYTESNIALIAIAPRTETVFTRETLGAIEELTEAGWRSPFSSRVNSLTNYTHSEAYEDDLVVAPLVEDAQSLSDDDLVRVEDIALNSIETVGRLVSHDGTVSALSITFILPDDSDPAVIEIVEHVNQLVDEFSATYPNIDFYLTGDIVMSHAFNQVSEDDVTQLVPIMILIISIFTTVLLRSILATVAVLVTLFFVVSTTMGVAGWLGVILTPANIVAPVILLTVAVAQTIHIGSTVFLGMRKGLDKKSAIVESLQINSWPIFLSSITTAIGFLSLNTSDSPPFRVLGNLVAFGMLCTWFYTMTLFPLLLYFLKLRAPPVRENQHVLIDRFSQFVVSKSSLLLIGGSLVAVVLSAGIFKIEFSDNWTLFFDDRYEFRRDTDFVIENLTGLESMEYSLPASREGGITDIEYLRAVDAFAEWYRSQPETAHVQAFPDIMKRLNMNLHGDDPEFYRLPEDPELASQYLLLYELSLPFGSDLNDRISADKSATRMTVLPRDRIASKHQRELDARANAWLSQNAPQLTTEATGLSIITAYLTQRNIHSLFIGMAIAMGIISLILLFVLKSARLGFISLVPNFVPLLMTFGIWGYLVGQVGLGGTMTSVIAFGIIVDDTIHFLSKYQKARRDGFAAVEAVRMTFRTVGHALSTTTVALTAGFLVLTLSGFDTSATLGAIVAITIAIALVADFLLLPSLLVTFDKKKNTQPLPG